MKRFSSAGSRAILAAILGFAHLVGAFWRMPCSSETGIGRLDPIECPGNISAHMHYITGSGGFGVNASYESLRQSNCTACQVKDDKSAYWVPPLYFMYTNGTTVIVPGPASGILVYYQTFYEGTKAFPAGFRMLAGNTYQRNFTGQFPDIPQSFWPTYPADQFWLQQRALGFNCFHYDAGFDEPFDYRHMFPSKEYMDSNCTDGLRLELVFPSCGNGSLDSADHSSHMAYPNLVHQGNCPDSHPIRYPTLYYEVIWSTNAFAGVDGQFLLATGDPTGTSYHGDFMMGWDPDFLQKAIDQCGSVYKGNGEIQECELFTFQTPEDAAMCKFEMPEILKDDDPLGPRLGLPVDVPIQYGPQQATKYPIAGQPGVPAFKMALPTKPAKFSLSRLAYQGVPDYTSLASSQARIMSSMNAMASGKTAPTLPPDASDTGTGLDPSATAFPEYVSQTSSMASMSSVVNSYGNMSSIFTVTSANAFSSGTPGSSSTAPSMSKMRSGSVKMNSSGLMGSISAVTSASGLSSDMSETRLIAPSMSMASGSSMMKFPGLRNSTFAVPKPTALPRSIPTSGYMAPSMSNLASEWSMATSEEPMSLRSMSQNAPGPGSPPQTSDSSSMAPMMSMAPVSSMGSHGSESSTPIIVTGATALPSSLISSAGRVSSGLPIIATSYITTSHKVEEVLIKETTTTVLVKGGTSPKQSGVRKYLHRHLRHRDHA